MMKFFKYLIFILLSFFSITAFAVTYEYRSSNSVITGDWMSTPELACKNFIAKWAPSAPYVRSSEAECVYKTTDGDRGSAIEKREATCKAGQEKFLDGYIGDFPPDSVCYSGCIYDSKGVWIGQGETSNGNLIWGTTATSTGTTCGADTPKGEDKPNTNQPMKPEECKSPTGSDGYCNKPSNKQCPTGYKQGSFNNQQICIKPSSDPTKPNPNDPNNGNGQGSCNGTNNCNTTNLDDTNIVNAINSSKTAITQAISSLSESISTALTTVTNAINGTTNAVNNNTNAVNAVKASVDALHNTINAVTTAVDNNTKAVNANAEKVANAVKDNIAATNAVKSAVDNLNSAVNAVSEAVNANGKNTVDAVNANGDKVTNAVNKGTEATKENGKKLDQIIKGQEEGNSLLKDIKDWLTGDNNLPENEKPTIEEHDVGDYEKSYVSWSASCPPDVQIPISLMGQSSTLVLKWSPWCELLSKIRWAIIACAYFSAAYIILGMRG